MMNIKQKLRLWVLAGGSLMAASIGLAQAMAVDISINKVTQKMTVTVDGEREYVWPVSTGAKGYETPTGEFKPFRMEKEHFSKEWDDAPMPNAVFFTTRGHAIHGSFYVKSLGRRASHGCVRLAPENAATLFELVKEAGMQNTRITLKGGFFDNFNQPSNQEREPRVSMNEPKPFFADFFGLSSGTHRNKDVRIFGGTDTDNVKVVKVKKVVKPVKAAKSPAPKKPAVAAKKKIVQASN